MTSHTLLIFQRLFDDLPPLVSSDIQKEMERTISNYKRVKKFELEKLENDMVYFGKLIWPERSAFREAIDRWKSKLGEIFLRNKLNKRIENKLDEFQAHGGDWQDIYGGGSAVLLTSEEKLRFALALVEMDNDIEKHTRQTVVSVEREWYENRIADLQETLIDIETKLNYLKNQLNELSETIDIQNELRSHIKEVEHGFCLLAPRPRFETLDRLWEHHLGRLKDRELCLQY